MRGKKPDNIQVITSVLCSAAGTRFRASTAWPTSNYGSRSEYCLSKCAGATSECPDAAAWKTTLSSGVLLHVQLGAEQRAREEDRQRHDDHQPQRGADGEGRRSVREENSSTVASASLNCLLRFTSLPLLSTWRRQFPLCVTSLCLQVSLWAEL